MATDICLRTLETEAAQSRRNIKITFALLLQMNDNVALCLLHV